MIENPLSFSLSVEGYFLEQRLKELIEYTETKLGLEQYHLHTYQLKRKATIFKETIYTLGMEWLPPHKKEREEDGLNPKGTASVEIDVHTRQLESVIFVGEKSFANGMTFQRKDKEEVIQWLERETGLVYEKQFEILKEKEQEFLFQACIDGVNVSPSGSMEVKFDEKGNLTFFSIGGYFPSKKNVKEETFTLKVNELEPFIMEQLKLIEFPFDEHHQLVPVYGIEEIYVTNDALETIPFELFVERRYYDQIDERLKWETPILEPFEGAPIDWQEEVSMEQVKTHEPHPDTLPITIAERNQVIQSVETFMRKQFPSDSGKWVLKTIHRENGYILATLKHTTPNNRIFQRKLNVFLDSVSLQVVNYLDNELLLATYEDFEAPGKITIQKEEAYEKIREEIELTPVYVYDATSQQYILCGKIDCPYGVHAATGEVFILDDLK